jgi:hypothetical protein
MTLNWKARDELAQAAREAIRRAGAPSGRYEWLNQRHALREAQFQFSSQGLVRRRDRVT